MSFNQTKFKNLVHYICHKADREKLGAVKLNKILWFSDVQAYVIWGHSITGESYVKQERGPTPRHIIDTLSQLVNENKLLQRDIDHIGYKKREYITLEHPDISSFNAEEISIVHDVIKEIIDNHTAQSISDATHTKIWELANWMEEIPYNTIFAVEFAEIKENDIYWAKSCI